MILNILTLLDLVRLAHHEVAALNLGSGGTASAAYTSRLRVCLLPRPIHRQMAHVSRLLLL